MKKIEAVIKPFKLDEVREALSEVGITGLTGIFINHGTSLLPTVGDILWNTGNSFILVAIPMFILAGNLMMRFAMSRFHSHRLIPVGLAVVLASLFLMPLPFFLQEEPSVLSIMGPVAIYCVGVAFFLPTLSTAALGPFPTMAGAAAWRNDLSFVSKPESKRMMAKARLPMK